MSRGGFVGFVCLLGFAFLRSQAKAGLIAAGSVLLLLGVLLVPQSYWEEMATIKDVKKGTASQRTETWKVGMRIFLDPKNTVFGVGFNNAPMLMKEYEPKINQSKYGKSFAGRALHSSFFQIIVDTGLVGLALFGSIVFASIVGSARLMRRVVRMNKSVLAMRGVLRAYALSLESGPNPASERAPRAVRIRMPEDDDSGPLNPVNAAGSLTLVSRELEFCVAVLTGLAASFAGALGGGFFVSTLYYPPFWMLATLTAMTQLHTERLLSASRAMLGAIEIEGGASPDEEDDRYQAPA